MISCKSIHHSLEISLVLIMVHSAAKSQEFSSKKHATKLKQSEIVAVVGSAVKITFEKSNKTNNTLIKFKRENCTVNEMWRFNVYVSGHLLPAFQQKNYRVEQDDKSVSLIMANVQSNDSGCYNISMPDDSSYQLTQLIVIEPTTTPQIMKSGGQPVSPSTTPQDMTTGLKKLSYITTSDAANLVNETEAPEFQNSSTISLGSLITADSYQIIMGANICAAVICIALVVAIIYVRRSSRRKNEQGRISNKNNTKNSSPRSHRAQLGLQENDYPLDLPPVLTMKDKLVANKEAHSQTKCEDSIAVTHNNCAAYKGQEKSTQSSFIKSPTQRNEQTQTFDFSILKSPRI